MNTYKIATSSTADLTRDYLDAHRIPLISYTYMVNGQVMVDDCREDSRQKVYEGMRAGDLLKTSMITTDQYEVFFRSQMKDGGDLIFLDMSEKMSTSFQNCGRAAETIREEFPAQRLYVMDTRCISGGLGLLVQEMVSRMEAGASFDEVIAWGEENKLKIAHRFTVDDLKYLKAGGRVSNFSALVGSLLSIKPVLYVPDRGTLEVVEKARGRKSALKSILTRVLRDMDKADMTGKTVSILHADCLADAESIRDGIRAAHPEIGEIRITSLGVVIGAHCGPGLLTVFYLCSGREE